MCVFECVCSYVCPRMCICVSQSAFMCVHMCTCVHLSMCAFMGVSVGMCLCVCSCVYVCVSMYECLGELRGLWLLVQCSSCKHTFLNVRHTSLSSMEVLRLLVDSPEKPKDPLLLSLVKTFFSFSGSLSKKGREPSPGRAQPLGLEATAGYRAFA